MSTRWQYLATQLRELTVKMKHGAGSEQQTSSAPALLSRALVATRLLIHRCRQESFPGFETWLQAVTGSLEFLADKPALTVQSERALAKLVAYAEQLMTKLDSGETLLSSVGTQQINEIQQQFLSTWGEPGSPPMQTRQPSTLSKPQIAPPGRILLLVSGLLRASALHERLKIASYQVVPCSDPKEAAKQLRTGKVFQAVLCDQVEPTRHLSRLIRLLLKQTGVVVAPLVLVTGIQQGDLTGHARDLGAAGAWTPPYRPSQLQEIIRRSLA
jgi:CheY-like chemotaxis protein